MVRSEILDYLRRFHEAMVDADIKTLTSLTIPDYYLIHVSGYKQSRSEWFDVVETESYTYHSIEIHYDTVEATEEGSKAVVHGRSLYDATIKGKRGLTRLEFTMYLANIDGVWTAEHSAYTTW